MRRFNKAMAFISGAVLVGVLTMTVIDIIGRSGFSRPFPGTVELTSMFLTVIVFLAVAHSEDMGDHITIDLIYERLGKRGKLFLDLFSDLLTIAVLALLSYQLYQFALRNLSSGAETPVLDWPMWPFVFVAAFGAALYTLSTVMRLTLRLMGEPVNAVDPNESASGGIEI